jgi:hypothetical protein
LSFICCPNTGDPDFCHQGFSKKPDLGVPDDCSRPARDSEAPAAGGKCAQELLREEGQENIVPIRKTNMDLHSNLLFGGANIGFGSVNPDWVGQLRS